MQIASAANVATVLDRLGKVPADFWVGLGLGVAAIVAAVILLRKLAGVNKVVLTALAGFFFMALGFSWIYERNEPTWAAPAVSFLAGFFPAKGSYSAGQKHY